MKWTNQYREDADIYLSYLTDCTIESEQNIYCIDLYNDFKDWFDERNPGVKKPNNKLFINGISKYHNIVKIKINYKSQLGFRFLALISDI